MTNPSFLQVMFAGYTPEQLAAGARDLADNLREVRDRGWGSRTKTLPKGVVHSIAYILDDRSVIESFDETPETILTKLAYNFYGAQGGGDDIRNGYPRTRAFLTSVDDMSRQPQQP